MASEISCITDVQHHPAAELMLYVEIKHLGIRQLPEVRVRTVDVGRKHGRGRTSSRRAGRIRKGRIGEAGCSRGNARISSLVVELIIDRVQPIEQAESTAKAGFTGTSGIPREPEAW